MVPIQWEYVIPIYLFIVLVHMFGRLREAQFCLRNPVIWERRLLAFAAKEDIGIRAFCGSGNEAMITIEDYMDGFEVDEKTKTVVLYIESIKNGRRFFESAKRVGKNKPVIVLKGGRTSAGVQCGSQSYWSNGFRYKSIYGRLPASRYYSGGKPYGLTGSFGGIFFVTVAQRK